MHISTRSKITKQCIKQQNFGIWKGYYLTAYHRKLKKYSAEREVMKPTNSLCRASKSSGIWDIELLSVGFLGWADKTEGLALKVTKDLFASSPSPLQTYLPRGFSKSSPQTILSDITWLYHSFLELFNQRVSGFQANCRWRCYLKRDYKKLYTKQYISKQ